MEMKFEPILEEGRKRPILMAGPCSAETEEQVLTTAHGLKDAGLDYFRAGIWKPRTRPGSFEGIGRPGLEWLKKVKEETGMKVTTEVATKDHLFEALKHGIDAVWIGARTTVNPFAVQEVADGLQGLDLPVFIKNPINPDINLWVGAIERIYRSGIRKIAVIHRGFSNFGESKYRNIPLWQLPIELKRRFPDLTFICDNSHICGNRELLQKVGQKALDLNYDGLMMEVHPNPAKAWSDAKQQLTPDAFVEMANNFVLREEVFADSKSKKRIEHLRNEIDEIDESLYAILGKRMRVAEEIGQYKKDNNIAILQTDRWNEILEKAFLRGDEKGLSHRFMEKFLRAVHEESIDHQERIMANGKS